MSEEQLVSNEISNLDVVSTATRNLWSALDQASIQNVRQHAQLRSIPVMNRESMVSAIVQDFDAHSAYGSAMRVPTSREFQGNVHLSVNTSQSSGACTNDANASDTVGNKNTLPHSDPAVHEIPNAPESDSD